MRKLFISALLILSAVLEVSAQEFIVRLNSFRSDLILVQIRITNGRPQVVKIVLAQSCIDTACTNKYSLAGDLTTFDAKLKDFAVNRTIQGPPKFSVVCTYVLPQGDDITLPQQRTGSFPNALRNTGISSFNVFEVNGKLQAAYFKFTDNPEIIAHATANVNRDTCNLAGPAKTYYTIRDDEYQASPKGASPIIGAIIKNSEGFELYFANVMQPGFVGETKLNVPGGQSVRVISAALAVGAIGISPGNAGVPSNKAFLMYRVLRQQGNTNQTSILLQQLQVQGTSIVATGAPKTIAPFSETGQPGAQSVHSLALSPNGDFALYTSFDVSCGKEVLKYQRLNPNTGTKNGGPITLLNCSNLASTSIGGYAIDLIPTLD